MCRFSGMDKHGRGAGRCKRGGDLMADMTGFAHAGNNNSPLAIQEQGDRLDEMFGIFFNKPSSQ